MDVMLKEEVSQLLEDVFTPDWELKVCGREKCQRLMFDLEKLFPGEYFGDTTTGYLKPNKIKDFAIRNGINPF